MAWQFHARSVSLLTTRAARDSRTAAFIAALNEYRVPVDSSWKDDRLRDICATARARGIYVYTIAFQTGFPGSPVLPICATTPAQHYTSTPSDIANAFAAIALHITSLQLTE